MASTATLAFRLGGWLFRVRGIDSLLHFQCRPPSKKRPFLCPNFGVHYRERSGPKTERVNDEKGKGSPLASLSAAPEAKVALASPVWQNGLRPIGHELV